MQYSWVCLENRGLIYIKTILPFLCFDLPALVLSDDLKDESETFLSCGKSPVRDFMACVIGAGLLGLELVSRVL